MNTQALLDPKSWAERTFGRVQLHDMRRTRRAVQAASNLAENPLGSLPAQMQTWKETKALYRLLDEPDVTFAALMQPHFQQSREQALCSPIVLLVQDTTDIDLSHRHKISGVGQIGNERGRGFFVQTVLAVLPLFRVRLTELAVRWREPAAQDYLLKTMTAFVITGVGGFALEKAGFKLPEKLLAELGWKTTWKDMLCPDAKATGNAELTSTNSGELLEA